MSWLQMGDGECHRRRGNFSPQNKRERLGSSRWSTYMLNHCSLERCWRLFNMKKRGTKAELLDVIFNTFKHVDAVSVAPPTTFVSDQNTFPRLCNIIMKYPQQLLATGVIASRVALQTNNVGAHQSLWLDAAEQSDLPSRPSCREKGNRFHNYE